MDGGLEVPRLQSINADEYVGRFREKSYMFIML